MGIRNFDTLLNKAFLGNGYGNMLLSIIDCGEKIIQGKFGDLNGGWCTKEEARKAFRVGLQKAIRVKN